jgi:hypothetical protein
VAKAYVSQPLNYQTLLHMPGRKWKKRLMSLQSIWQTVKKKRLSVGPWAVIINISYGRETCERNAFN